MICSNDLLIMYLLTFLNVLVRRTKKMMMDKINTICYLSTDQQMVSAFWSSEFILRFDRNSIVIDRSLNMSMSRGKQIRPIISSLSRWKCSMFVEFNDIERKPIQTKWFFPVQIHIDESRFVLYSSRRIDQVETIVQLNKIPNRWTSNWKIPSSRIDFSIELMEWTGRTVQ